MYICYFLLSERVCDSQISYFLLPRRWLIRRACIHQSVNVALRSIYSLLLMLLKEIECILHLKLTSSRVLMPNASLFNRQLTNSAHRTSDLSNILLPIRNWCPQCLGIVTQLRSLRYSEVIEFFKLPVYSRLSLSFKLSLNL
jgi:hypothetical protein